MIKMGLLSPDKVIKDKSLPSYLEKYNNLCEEATLALFIFNILPDKLEGMNGIWLGKDFSGLDFIFTLYCEDLEYKYIFELLLVIIREYGEYYAKKQEKVSK